MNALTVVAVLVAVAAAVVTTVAVSRCRAAARRITVATARLGDEHPPQGGVPLQLSLARLDRMVTRVVAARQLDERRAAQVTAALDGLTSGVVIVSRSGEVVRNAAARHFLGVRSSDAVVERTVAQLIQVALTGEVARRTFELFGPPRRVVTVSATPFVDARGEPGALAVVDDVTERQRLEAARTDFVANITHELKTPVGALTLLAETLADERDPEVADRLVRRISAEAQRMSALVDDLLELAMIEAGATFRQEQVPVALVMAEAVQRARAAAEAKDIAISVEEPSWRLSVVGDRRQLVSALGNLVENAVKYSDPGSPVQVTAGTDGRWVELSVIDRGIGIPARDLDRIFERFYRVDRARSRETGGTGLGLSIVRHVVQNHDGTVQVRSREGAGSTFTLRLPAGPGPVALPAPRPDAEVS